MLDIATGIVNDRIAFDNMSPDQKRAVISERELEDLRAENERLRREREEEEEAASAREAYNAHHADIVREIEAQGYEAEDDLIAEVAETMALAHESGYDYVDARRAAREVLEVRAEREREMVKRLKVENLPEELVEKILKASVEKFKKSPPKQGGGESRRQANGAHDERRSRRVSGLKSTRF